MAHIATHHGTHCNTPAPEEASDKLDKERANCEQVVKQLRDTLTKAEESAQKESTNNRIRLKSQDQNHHYARVQFMAELDEERHDKGVWEQRAMDYEGQMCWYERELEARGAEASAEQQRLNTQLHEKCQAYHNLAQHYGVISGQLLERGGKAMPLPVGPPPGAQPVPPPPPPPPVHQQVDRRTIVLHPFHHLPDGVDMQEVSRDVLESYFGGFIDVTAIEANSYHIPPGSKRKAYLFMRFQNGATAEYHLGRLRERDDPKWPATMDPKPTVEWANQELVKTGPERAEPAKGVYLHLAKIREDYLHDGEFFWRQFWREPEWFEETASSGVDGKQYKVFWDQMRPNGREEQRDPRWMVWVQFASPDLAEATATLHATSHACPSLLHMPLPMHAHRYLHRNKCHCLRIALIA